MTEKICKQYIKSDGLNFCMSSVCLEKDCIYALVNKLHQTIDRSEQERDELKKACEKCKLFNIEETNRNLLKRIDKLEQENKELKEMYRLSCLKCEYKNTKADVDKCRSALEEINRTLLGVRGLSIHCDKQIIKVKAIVNEVLNA